MVCNFQHEKGTKTMSEKFGVAIIGYGGMGSWHARQLKTMGEIQLCGIYDIDPERNTAAEAAGIHAYESMQALLQDPQVRLVTIAIPNDQHKGVAIAAMQAGKNVVCEKPVALSSDEVRDMVKAAKACKVLFTVHQNRRWDEDYLTMKKIYEEGRLGRVFKIESRVHGSRGIPSDWRNQKACGGGMVLDWGVHLLDQMLMMVKEPVVSVYADLDNVTNEEVDDGFKAIIHFAPKVAGDPPLSCHVEVGTSNFINLPRWYMLGENGSAVIEDWERNGKIVMVSDWEKRDAVPVVTAAGLTKTMAPRTEETIQEYPLPEVHSDVRDFYRNLIDAVDGRAEQIVKHHEILRSMRLMEAIMRSAETGEAVHWII